MSKQYKTEGYNSVSSYLIVDGTIMILLKKVLGKDGLILLELR